MTTVARLLARKQQLLERLQEDTGSHEREEIERLLAEIDTALNALDEAPAARTTDD
jgi:predicted CopG family antitoxin